MIDVPRERFEELVADALDGIPEELGGYMDNVAVFVVDRPPEPNLLGLYQGVPLTARGTSYSGTMPDRISIYRRTICAICNSEEEVVEQVRRTVIHEVAHHFGISDPRLRELGW
jgi:predicted Zn-dependent protease with MMP-like domain